MTIACSRPPYLRAQLASGAAWVALLALGAGLAAPAMADAPTADSGAAQVREVVVTLNRSPEDADRVPAYVTVLQGADLRARGVRDLNGALSLVAGAEAPSGGDAGPASAVASFWGLHEFDAFLLVVDGVPWGGAFNPAISSLNMADVQRIEVLKGAAPVMYGATAFVGVIQVIHYPAGQAADQVEAGGGSFGSWRGSASIALPAAGGLQQSFSVSASRDGFADRRENVRDLRALYRASTPLFGGELRLDASASRLRSVPSSPVVRDGAALTLLTPRDANYNVSDAGIDEDAARLTLAYTHDTPLGAWETTAALGYSHVRDARGFLRPDLIDDGSSANADSQNQRRDIQDDYFDTHINHVMGDLRLIVGADLLYGRGTQSSRNGEYYAPFTGGPALPGTGGIHVDETNVLYDRRVFAGQYVQAEWKPAPRWDLLAGIRLNETSEHKLSTHLDGFDPLQDTFDDESRKVTRLSGMAGVTYRAWESGADEAVLFANWRNTFKPAAIDFGPDNTPDILKPETANSFEIGAKGAGYDGRLTWEAGLFLLDFKNLVVVTTDALGDRIVQNAGGERLKGAEAEARWRLSPNLSLSGALSYHDARFTHYIAEQGGANIDVSGNQLTLSPKVLASLGLVYDPAEGWNASIVARYVDSRFLDIANTAKAKAYAMVDATLGYRWGRHGLRLSVENLTDQRQPVTQSEFGDSSYYLTPPRKVFLDLIARF